ncbi:hypothetical protein [Paenibacillus psychroresistens]|nr:hypothetical protein [Paenibacillus psychroresistens]
MIKPIELHEFMFNQLTPEQKASEAITELLPVIVRGIIKAVESKN